MLENLAVQRTSGVLAIDGNPAGAIYLDRGQITFAKASWIPDVTARLSGTIQPSVEVRELLLGGDRADRDIGTMLVRRRCLTRSELQAILRSVVVDAVIALTVPLADVSFVSEIRFEAPGAHWAGGFSRLRVDWVRAEAVRRAERIARYNLARTACVTLCDLGRASAVVRPEQWAVASKIGRVMSIQDLAWQCGLALYETVECVGELVRAGLCALGPTEPPVSVIPPAPMPAPVVLPAPRPAVPLPRRGPGLLPPRPRIAEPVGAAEPVRAERPGEESAPPAPELLHRVLDGLRRLS